MAECNMIKIAQSSSKFIEMPDVLKSNVAAYLSGREIALLLAVSKNGVKKDAAMEVKVRESREAQMLRARQIALACEKLVQVADQISFPKVVSTYQRVNQLLSVAGSLFMAAQEPLKGLYCMAALPTVISMTGPVKTSNAFLKTLNICSSSFLTVISTGWCSRFAPVPVTAAIAVLTCINGTRMRLQN